MLCTVGSLFANGTSSISKQDKQQLAQHLPFDFNNLPIYAELNEEDLTGFDSDLIGIKPGNDYYTFFSNPFVSEFCIADNYFVEDQSIPVFLSNRSIRI